MVLKKSKFNANTGNTLRRVCGCSTKGVARYIKTNGYITKDNRTKNPYVIPRREKDITFKCRSYDDIEEQTFLNLAEGVPYSLNKRKRWLIPDDIKQKLRLRDTINEVHDVQNKKSSRKKQSKSNNRKRYEIKLITTERGYYGQSKTGRHQKTWTGLLHTKAYPREEIDLTYNVHTVSDPVGFLCSEANSKRYNSWYSERKKKNSKYLKSLCYDIYRDYDEGNLYNTDDEDHFTDDQEIAHKDAIHLLTSKGRDSKFASESNKLDKNDHVVNGIVPKHEAHTKMFGLQPAGIAYAEYCDALRQINVDSENGSKMVNYEMHCLVENHKIDRDFLCEHFGNYFSEGKCSPRRFCVFDKNFIQTESFLIVHELRENNGKTEVIIKLLNIAEDIVMLLNVQRDNSVFPFDFLLDLCFNLDAVRSYYITHVFKLPNSSLMSSSHFCTNNSTKSWEVIKLEDVWLTLINNGTRTEQNSQTSAFIQEQNCPICFSDSNITYLDSCGHYLCDICWEKFIDGKVSSGCYTVICPDSECKEQVEPIVILTYLSEDLAMLFIKRRSDIAVQCMSTMKPCPAVDCTKVASLSADTVIKNNVSNPSVTCTCKLLWCFNCQDEDHWPSSCEANKKYKEEIIDKSTYDEEGNLVNNTAFVKKCPHCSYPIEKEGGCDHMTCSCGGQFCWICRSKLTNEAQIHNCREDSAMKVVFNNSNSIDIFKRANIVWSKKADIHKEYLERLVRQLRRIDSSSNAMSVDPNYDPPEERNLQWEGTRRRSMLLLVQCYKILKNICIETAFRDSRHLSSRTKLYIGKRTPVLDRLFRQVIDREYVTLTNFKQLISNTTKGMEAAKTCLNDLVTFSSNFERSIL